MLQFDRKAGGISIEGPLGPSEWGETPAEHVATVLERLSRQPIRVEINSSGGSLDEGLEIYRELKDYPGHVTTVCTGVACSSASLVFLAGDSRILGTDAKLMIHECFTVAVGGPTELKRVLADLEPILTELVEIYAVETGNNETTIRDWLAAETWFNSDEAIENNFAHQLIEDAGREPDFAGIERIARRVPDWALEHAAVRFPRRFRTEVFARMLGRRLRG